MSALGILNDLFQQLSVKEFYVSLRVAPVSTKLDFHFMSDTADLNTFLSRSVALHEALSAFIALSSRAVGSRSQLGRVICGISYEHGESVKVLTASGNFTSAVGIMRLQYEATLRAFWVFYAASGSIVGKLVDSLSEESERKASKLPPVGEML